MLVDQAELAGVVRACVFQWLGDYAEQPECRHLVTDATIAAIVRACHEAADSIPAWWDGLMKETHWMPMISLGLTEEIISLMFRFLGHDFEKKSRRRLVTDETIAQLVSECHAAADQFPALWGELCGKGDASATD